MTEAHAPETLAAAGEVRRWIMGASAATLVAYSVWILIRELNADRAWIIAEYVALPGALAAWLLAWRGVVPAAAVTLIATVALQEHFAFVLSRSVLLNLGTPVLPVLVAGAGLLIGTRAAWVVAAGMILSVPAATALGERLFGPPQPVAGLSEFYALVALDLTNLVAAVIVTLGAAGLARTRHAVRTAEIQRAGLMRHSTCGIALLDGRGHVQALSPVAAALLNVPEADLLGRPFADALAVPATSRHAALPLPEDDVPVGTELEFERDGERRIVEVAARRLEAGDERGSILVTLRDATEERMGRHRADWLGWLLDRAPTEVYVVDPGSLQLRFVNATARRNLGYAAGELDTLPMTAIAAGFTHAYARRLETDLDRQPDGDVATTGEHRRKDGSTYPVRTRAYLLGMGGERLFGLFVTESGVPSAR